MDSEYFTVAEVAARINRSEGMVSELCRRGKLAGAIKNSDGSWRIPKNSVEHWLQNRNQTSRHQETANMADTSGNELPDSNNKVPNIWEWAWQKIPNALKPVVMFSALLLIVLAFLLNIADVSKNVFSNPQSTPTKIAEVSESSAIHIGGYFDYSICTHDAWVISDGALREVLSLYPDNEWSNKFDEHAYTIAPAELHIDFLQERRSEYDQVVINSVELQLFEYQPFNDNTEVVLKTGICAGGNGNHPLYLGSLQLNPNQTTYDVLHPRATSPQIGGIPVDSSITKFIIKSNAIVPGKYFLKMKLEYVINGQQFTEYPIEFIIAVPDETSVQTLYQISEGEWVGPYSSQPFFDAYLSNQSAYINMDFITVANEEDRLSGIYIYLVNMGKDIDLTGWVISREDEEIFYTFPSFVLKAGSGIRVWEGRGEDTNQDLFGLNNLNLNSRDSYILTLQDSSRNWIARTFVNAQSD